MESYPSMNSCNLPAFFVSGPAESVAVTNVIGDVVDRENSEISPEYLTVETMEWIGSNVEVDVIQGSVEPPSNHMALRGAAKPRLLQTSSSSLLVSFVCKLCENSYLSETALASHTRKRHGFEALRELTKAADSELVQCGVCARQLVSRDDYRRHMQRKHGADGGPLGMYPNPQGFPRRYVYNCDVCREQYDNKVAAIAHRKLIHNKESFDCDICGKLLGSKGSLVSHCKALHRGQSWFCSVCNKSFVNRTLLHAHFQRYHMEPFRREPEVPGWACDKCPRSFRGKAALVQHMVRVHGTGGGPTANGSGESRAGSTKAASRPRVAKPQLSKPVLECMYCAKVFSGKMALMQHHKVVHSGVATEACKECGKVVTKHNLPLHIRVVHQQLKKHVCDICGAAFPFPYKLRQHVRGVHYNKFDFVCSVCDTKFKYGSMLAAHRTKFHAGVKG